MSLISLNSYTTLFNNGNNGIEKSKIYKSPKFSNILILPRECDIIEFEYLELNFFDSLTIQHMDIINSIILTMKIHDEKILTIPLSLLINLKNPIIINNFTYYIDLQFNMFFSKNIKLLNLQYSNISFSIEFDEFNSDLNSYICNFGLVCNLTLLDNSERKKLIQQSLIEYPIQQIQFINIKIDIIKNKFKLKIPFNGLIKGFFINAPIQYLSYIELLFNNEIRYDYNKFLILKKCQKINENLLYVPFETSKSYLDNSINSYKGSTNLSKIELIEMKLEFDNEIEILNEFKFVKILGLNYNNVMFINGLGKLSYNII